MNNRATSGIKGCKGGEGGGGSERKHRFLYWAGSDRISWQKLKPLSCWNDRLEEWICRNENFHERSKETRYFFPTVINAREYIYKLINAQ